MAKKILSTSAQFCSSLAEARRLSNRDPFPQDPSIHCLLDHLDMIMARLMDPDPEPDPAQSKHSECAASLVTFNDTASFTLPDEDADKALCVAQPLPLRVPSPLHFLLSDHSGATWTYSDLVSSERAAAPPWVQQKKEEDVTGDKSFCVVLPKVEQSCESGRRGGADGRWRAAGRGSFERHLFRLTSTHISFVQAQQAIQRGLHSDQDFLGLRILHLLLGCVEALCGSGDGLALAAVMLARLRRLVDVRGDAIQRVAAHFAAALQHAFGIDVEDEAAAPAFSQACVGGAFPVLHEVLPYIKFAHFTANQALLEAFQGKQEMHVIDYDIMEGLQWPPLMQALVTAREQSLALCTTPTKLKITAVCRQCLPPNSIASTVRQTGRRLAEFAQTLGLEFEFEAVKEPDSLQGGWEAIFQCTLLQATVPQHTQQEPGGKEASLCEGSDSISARSTVDDDEVAQEGITRQRNKAANPATHRSFKVCLETQGNKYGSSVKEEEEDAVEEAKRALTQGRKMLDSWEAVVARHGEQTVESWLRISSKATASILQKEEVNSSRRKQVHIRTDDGVGESPPHKRRKRERKDVLLATRHKAAPNPICVAVNCMIQLPHMAHREADSVSEFLSAVRNLSPHILTVGEEAISIPGTEDFPTSFCDSLYHFCAFSDSLEESLVDKNLATALVEQLFCAPRILSLLRSAKENMKRAGSHNGRAWSSLAHTAGFLTFPISQANKSQARLLLQHFKEGYEVVDKENAANQEHRLILAWKTRPIVAVSAWKTMI